ncbi:MAG: RluA family pseudouridine synthase [Bacteroidales bacterium]|jgi:23S rRNA pseudouridine1911/1915/1917 synthase|nr:RluA family pseudouridine synthase [Bacteroidales bacterium]
MTITETDVIFEDNHLIAVNKRIGDIVQGDKTGDAPLSELVKDFLRKKYNKTGNVYCGVIHRIDRPVSGAVIFAKTSKALARMNQLVHDRQIRKHYWAIVKNAPAVPQDELVHYLFKDERRNMVIVSKKPKDGYLKAEMNYQLVASSNNYHLLEIELLTGRHHQIRAQLSAIGSPIKGDLKYGFPRSNADASICLHAKSLSFIHPVTLQTTLIEATPPNEKLWNFFAEYTGAEEDKPPVE